VRSAKQVAAGGVALAILMTVIVALQMVRERRYAESEPAQQILYVNSPAALTRLALSYDAIVADLYWIRAIQHYGGTRLSNRPDRSYDLLYPLLDLTTSLDPHFGIAYRFGAFFLSEKKPGGAGRSDLAIRLLNKAMAAEPDRWEFLHDIGFVHYRDGDYGQAAEWFERAAKLPSAMKKGERADLWLWPLAANTRATGGDTRSSRTLYEHMLTSEAAWLREDAARRLKKLDAIDQIVELERLTHAYAQRFRDGELRWADLTRSGLLRSVPLDPAGHPYVLNPWWGDVTVSEDSPIWPLPTENPA
jgi:tetratricopeptide (TPR) repeat protein